MEVYRGVCGGMQRGVQRYAEVHRDTWRCMEVHGGVHGGM